MSPIEIFLLICGGVIFILSFIIPVSKEEASEEIKELARDEIKKLVSEEMDGIKSHVDDAVDEAVEYAMEKTERSLERLSNEKIMAVSDYSDTVLQEIHKNHEEVMFLYDMLNDKHKNLKNTVSEVNQTVKAVKETTREAEAAVNSFRELVPDKVEDGQVIAVAKETAVLADEKQVKTKSSGNSKVKGASDKNSAENSAKKPVKEESVSAAAVSDKMNRNEEILRLHELGKSNVAIAKQLGMGVGEVKLVIDLYKNK